MTGRSIAKQGWHDSHMLGKLLMDRLTSSAVSYRVTIAGKTVEMDSPEEVYRLLSASPTLNGQTVEVEERRGLPAWDMRTGMQFIKSLGYSSPQSALIRELYHGTDDGMPLGEVLQTLKMTEPRQLGGVLSGLAKNAKKLGLKSPIEIERTRNGKGERSYIYRLDPLFKVALEGINQTQPPNTERDLPELRDFIRGRRAALFGFLEQGARLALDGDRLEVKPRNEIYVRYLNDNVNIIADLASECYGRRITATIVKPPERFARNAQNQRNDAPASSGAPRPEIPNGPPVPPHLR